MPDKLCPTCKTLKPTTEFHRDRSKSDGLNLYCKPCMIARQKTYAMRPPRHQAPEGMKRCMRCKETKAVSEFYTSTRFHDGLDRRCKTCCAALHQDWRLNNLDKAAAHSRKWRAENATASKDHGRKNRYGLPMGKYEEMLAEQRGMCLICDTTNPGGRGDFHVDHCHASGKVRGLLCSDCNLGLGKFKDSPERLLRAVKYLAKRGGER